MHSNQSNTSQSNSKRVSRHEAAKLLGISYTTLNKWATDGDPAHFIPYSKLGKKAIYNTADLDKFIEKNMVGMPVNEMELV